MPDHGMDHEMDPADRAAAMLATAGYQDVATAEAAGYASSLDTLGCFTDPELGGMGLHYIDQSLMDDQVDITEPEALVYELDANGDITGLVAHEYIVPIDAWTAAHAAAAVRDGLPPAPDAPAVGPPRLAVEGQPDRHLPGLEPSRAAVPARASPSSARTCRADEQHAMSAGRRPPPTTLAVSGQAITRKVQLARSAVVQAYASTPKAQVIAPLATPSWPRATA